MKDKLAYEIIERQQRLEKGGEPEWYGKVRIPERFIMSYKNRFKVLWDESVLVFATYNAFFMPM